MEILESVSVSATILLKFRFRTDGLGIGFGRKFWNWYSSQSQEVKELIPIDNINKLALGRYYMGQLIYDETFLNYHDDVNDWLYDAELKSRWNREVFSLIESATKIEIIE